MCPSDQPKRLAQSYPDYALDITPKPDRILRVYLRYRPAAAEEVLPEPAAVLPLSREGFTVVEWGGQLLG